MGLAAGEAADELGAPDGCGELGEGVGDVVGERARIGEQREEADEADGAALGRGHCHRRAMALLASRVGHLQLVLIAVIQILFHP